MIDALPQPPRKGIHRGISSETIEKITKKPETSVPSTSKVFQRSQSGIIALYEHFWFQKWPFLSNTY